MAPLFIAASFLYGLSFTVLVLIIMTRETREELMDDEMIAKFRGLLLIFAFGVLFFTAVQHLTKFYSAEHRGVELFLLRDGGVYPLVFWLGQIVIGSLAPLAFCCFVRRARRPAGADARLDPVPDRRPRQMYVTIIGGQAYPLDIFPGYQVSSSFFDGRSRAIALAARGAAWDQRHFSPCF